MAKTFYQFSAYPIPVDYASSKEMFDDLVKGPGNLVLATYNEKAVGMIGFLVSPFPLNKHVLMGTEIMWWVEPEHRGSIVGKELVSTAETLAKVVWKASYFAMSKLKNSPEALPVIYKRWGYTDQDTTYLKEI